MKIFITGHNGFIGTEMQKAFQKHELVFSHVDIREQEYIDVDFVIHLAAKVSAPKSLANPKEYYDVNVNGSANIFEVFNDKPMIVFSSSSVDEWWRNPYGSTKKMMELITPEHAVIARPFNVFPGRDDMLIKKLQNNEVTVLNANHKRDWTPVDEVVKACEIIVDEYDMYSGSTIDFGTGTSIPNIYWANKYNYKGKLNFDETPNEREETKANPIFMSHILGRPVKSPLDYD